MSHALGAFLGYFLVRSEAAGSQGLDEMARHIAARTRPIKARHRYLDSLVNMQFINTIWPWLSATTRCHFMRKSLPISGGISNVVVHDAWMNQNRHLILDYHRGVSTGPCMPIVISPTTFGDHLNVGVSYRMAGFSRAKIDAVMELFREQIEHPNKASRGGLRRRPAAVPSTPDGSFGKDGRLVDAVNPSAAVGRRTDCQSVMFSGTDHCAVRGRK